MASEPVRAGADWLALREPADAAARAAELVDELRPRLPAHGPLRIHDLAAILLICSLAVAVWSHAWPDRPSKWSPDMPVVSNEGQFEVWYRAIFVLMTVGAVALGAIFAFILDWDHTIILLEWYEILLFMAFWVLETQREGRIEPVNVSAHEGLQT